MLGVLFDFVLLPVTTALSEIEWPTLFQNGDSHFIVDYDINLRKAVVSFMTFTV